MLALWAEPPLVHYMLYKSITVSCTTVQVYTEFGVFTQACGLG